MHYTKTLAAGIAVAMTSISTQAIAAASSTADENKVYGKLNVSYQRNDNEAEDSAWSLESNASRIGFKGSTKIEGDTSVIYQIEYETFVDDGDKSGDTLTQRNTYVGLKGGFGTIKAGKFDTPLKKAQGKFDLFNDLVGDIKKVVEGDNRADNILQYSTKKIADSITVNVAIMPGETAGDGDLDGPADAISASVTYDSNGLFLALAADSDITSTDTSVVPRQDIIRLVGSYKAGDATISALYQSAETSVDGTFYADGEDEADSFGVSASYKMGKNVLKIQYVDSDANAKIAEGEQISLGIDHKLGKKSKVFAFYTSQDAKKESKQTDYLGIGLEHKFN